MNVNRLPQQVLIVDDSELQRQFIAALCCDMGITSILHAVDGYDAIARLKTSPQIEAIILDLKMPSMDGMQVLYEMANLRLVPPVVVASGQGIKLLNVVENMAKGLRLLSNLQKPLFHEQLLAWLEGFTALPMKTISSGRWAPELKLIEHEVIRALHEREFTAYLRPKVQLAYEALKGVEALVRWQHSKHGLLAPGCFIGLIERSRFFMRSKCRPRPCAANDHYSCSIRAPRAFSTLALMHDRARSVSRMKSPGRKCVRSSRECMMQSMLSSTTQRRSTTALLPAVVPLAVASYDFHRQRGIPDVRRQQ